MQTTTQPTITDHKENKMGVFLFFSSLIFLVWLGFYLWKRSIFDRIEKYGLAEDALRDRIISKIEKLKK